MATEPTPSASQADATTSTPAPVAINTPDPQAGDGQQETISLDEARKLRKEAQALRTRLNGYEAQEKAAQEAALSEVDKANKRASELEQQLQQSRHQLVEAEVRLALKSRELTVNPDLLAPAVMQKLEYEGGKPTNLEKVLDELVKANPTIVKPEATTPAQSNTPTIPAMNPGRANIQSPGTLAPNKTVSLTDRSIWGNNR